MQSISGKDYKLVSLALASLESDPYQSGCTKLKGIENTFRIRAGNYRILYQVYDKVLTVEVVDIGNRKDIYE
ncbi:type II toxin-antitoxin system RelE family toxin [Dyadobacter aurulentus]|uniref:type II toxin-antitoxin system RelE family toxin n=1 Tax=Dyadobacter sp. UC 10 TaxID=2605428 RepID=UPI001CED1B67|nr:type II toxin-antitoxin system RelE/ParE family toxin [Dyadobacter sp. UC 10]